MMYIKDDVVYPGSSAVIEAMESAAHKLCAAECADDKTADAIN
jgi:hypothetical protein